MKEKISLAGELGSGKSTVSDILISRLGAEYYSTGSIVRSIAERMGMTITELNKYMETHPEIDEEIDRGIADLSDLDKLLVIDSRMAWHFTKGTFKVYLSVDVETSALRIMNAGRKEEKSSSLDEAIAATLARRNSEQKRYLSQYGVDIKDLTNYSLIVDSTVATPDEVAQVIIDSFDRWCDDKSYSMCFLSPERLNYIDDEPDNELVGRYAAELDLGRAIPEVTVFEVGGEFYVENGLESALAYSFNMSKFVPAKLIKGQIGDREYVKMKNSL